MSHVSAIRDQAFTRETLQHRLADAGPDGALAHLEHCNFDALDLSPLDLHDADLTGLRLADARLFKAPRCPTRRPRRWWPSSAST